jgi:hypothetical protein
MAGKTIIAGGGNPGRSAAQSPFDKLRTNGRELGISFPFVVSLSNHERSNIA